MAAPPSSRAAVGEIGGVMLEVLGEKKQRGEFVLFFVPCFFNGSTDTFLSPYSLCSIFHRFHCYHRSYFCRPNRFCWGACGSRRHRCRGVDDGVIRSCKFLIVVSFFKRLSLYHFASNLSLPLTAFPSRSIRLLNEESVGAVTWTVGGGGGFNASI